MLGVRGRGDVVGVEDADWFAKVMQGAAKRGHAEMVESVVTAVRVNPHVRAKAMRDAAVNGHVGVVAVLAKTGTRVTPAVLSVAAPAVRAWMDWALASAVRDHDFASIAAALAAGAQPGASIGAAALRWAAHYGVAEVVAALLRAGVDPRSERSLALRWALNAGHDAIAATLVAAGARLGDVDRSNVPEERLAQLVRH